MADDRTARALEGLVDLLSRIPGLAETLVWDHRPDDFGRCSARCRAGGDASLVMRHPCTTAECATSALFRFYRRAGRRPVGTAGLQDPDGLVDLTGSRT